MKAANHPAYRWTNVTMDAPFRPRDGAGALVFNDRMFLLGGWNPRDPEYYPRHCVNDVWSSADGHAWEMVKGNSFHTFPFWDLGREWEGTHTAGYAVFRGRMWIVGGDPIQGHYQPDVWNSADGRAWEFVNRGRPVPWAPRVLHHCFVFKDRLWVLGGQTLPQFAPAAEVFYHDVWNTADGLNWDKVEMRQPFTPERGMIAGSAIFKDRIWLLGGGTYETPGRPHYVFNNDVWSSADGSTWEKHLDAAPWAPRVYHSVSVFDDRLWVLQGYTPGGNINDVWHSADGINWEPAPAAPWKARHAASVFVFANALWVVAGSHLQSDIWKLARA